MMDAAAALVVALVILYAGWSLSDTFRTAVEVEANAAEIKKAHKAEEAARREALACIQSLVRQKQANIHLWELVSKHCDLLVHTMGVAKEFGSDEALAWLASEMSGETWDQMVALAEKAKR